jgi:hypothetical protein
MGRSSGESCDDTPKALKEILTESAGFRRLLGESRRSEDGEVSGNGQDSHPLDVVSMLPSSFSFLLQVVGAHRAEEGLGSRILQPGDRARQKARWKWVVQKIKARPRALTLVG